MKKIIGKALIVIGAGIILLTAYTNYNVEKNNNDLVKEFEKNIQNNKNSESKQMEKGEEKTINNKQDVIAILEIPKIDLKVAVKEGIDQKTLDYSVGHFDQTQMPGQYGNFAVAGHRNYTSNKFFSNLDELERGDNIVVHTLDEKYTYIVDSKEVVTPDKVEVLDSDENKKMITLITCTPKYVGTHRLVVNGYIE